MKKILLSLVVPLVFMTTLSAQISQEQADQIIIERLSNEAGDFTIYAKEDMQTEFEITTSNGEIIELDYPCWVYYVSYTGVANGKYLVVKESNGNVLEVNTKNDAGPDDLEKWRIVGNDDYPIKIPFEKYSLEETSCQWIDFDSLHEGKQGLIIINNNEELENYISCTEGTYPDIDFSKHSLLLAYGTAGRSFAYLNCGLWQFSIQNYEMKIDIFTTHLHVITPWTVAIIVDKLSEGSSVALNVTYEEAYHSLTITPNKTWNIEVGMPCPEGFCYLGITTIKTGDIKTFKGKEYYELLRTDDPFQQEEEIITYVREKNGQVFFYVEDCDMEYLMYDYNLKVDNEVYLVDPRYPFSLFDIGSCEITEEEMNDFYKCKIVDIDAIVYDQVARKRLKVAHSFFGRYDYWVEGIGAMEGITYQISSQMVGTVHQLKDCYEADELIFENENPEYIWDN